MLRRVVTQLSILALLLGAASAAAQRPFNVPNYYVSQLPVLEQGQPFAGELTEDDGQNFKDGSFVDLYLFDAQANDVVTVTVDTGDFYATISVFDMHGNLIAMSDMYNYDYGSSAQIEVYPYEDGRYMAVVSGQDSYSLGSYEITVNGGGLLSQVEAIEVAVPSKTTGYIESTNPTAPYGWTGPSAAHMLTLTEAAALRIVASSQDFDTYLYLYDSTGYWIADNDDAAYSEATGFSTDSAIFVYLEPGTYFVYVATWEAEGSGAYELEVQLFVPQE